MLYKTLMYLKNKSVKSKSLLFIKAAYKITAFIMHRHDKKSFIYKICNHNLYDISNAELEIYAFHPEKWKG